MLCIMIYSDRLSSTIFTPCARIVHIQTHKQTHTHTSRQSPGKRIHEIVHLIIDHSVMDLHPDSIQSAISQSSVSSSLPALLPCPAFVIFHTTTKFWANLHMGLASTRQSRIGIIMRLSSSRGSCHRKCSTLISYRWNVNNNFNKKTRNDRQKRSRKSIDEQKLSNHTAFTAMFTVNTPLILPELYG